MKVGSTAPAVKGTRMPLLSISFAEMLIKVRATSSRMLKSGPTPPFTNFRIILTHIKL